MNWIKMRTSLRTDGRVRIVANRMRASCSHVCGALFFLWCLADEHCDENGVLFGWTKTDVDEFLGLEGFCDSLPADWIDLSGEHVKLPEYQAHNGKTAKRRASEQKRMSANRSVRKPFANRSQSVRKPFARARTREEKSTCTDQYSTSSVDRTSTPLGTIDTHTELSPSLEVAPGIFLTEKERAQLVESIGRDELSYWVDQLSTARAKNAPAFDRKYRCHAAVVRSWRNLALKRGEVWDEQKKLYREAPRGFEGRAKQNLKRGQELFDYYEKQEREDA